MQGKIGWWTLKQFIATLWSPLELPHGFADRVGHDLPYYGRLRQYVHGGPGYDTVGIARRGGTPNASTIVVVVVVGKWWWFFRIGSTWWISFQNGNLDGARRLILLLLWLRAIEIARRQSVRHGDSRQTTPHNSNANRSRSSVVVCRWGRFQGTLTTTCSSRNRSTTQ